MTDRATPSPAACGYRMPAEWAPHRATWLSWPHNRETWPDEIEEVERVMAQAVAALAPHEVVRINVSSPSHERHVRMRLDDAGVRGDVIFHHIPTDDAWIRDHGAVFVKDAEGHLAATVWRFNSWGEKYPPWDLDDRAAGRMAEALGVLTFDGGMVLEGGSVDVNGAGLLVTTEACLLHPDRNPTLTKRDVERRLKAFFGVDEVLWLGEGIAGDDTDGHVDDLTRFVAPGTVVTVVEDDTGSPNHAPLQENLARLHDFCVDDSRRLDVVALPMPAEIVLRGEIMPASYANFYVGNGVVLVPAYDDPADAVAQRILADLFPDRSIVPLRCRRLIWGLGAIHCLTQQVPR